MPKDVKVRVTGDASSLSATLDGAEKRVASSSASMTRSLKAIGVGLGAAIGVAGAASAALLKLATDAAAAGDAIDKGAQRAGVTTDAYQQLTFAAGQAGASAESMTAALSRLASTKDPVLRALGSTEDRLKALADRVRGAASEQAGLQIANAALGRGLGRELLPLLRRGSEEIARLSAEADRLGVVMSAEAVAKSVEFSDSLDALKLQLTTVRNELGAQLLPALTDGAQRMSAFIASAEGKEQIKSLTDATLTLAQGLGRVAGAGASAVNALDRFGQTAGDVLLRVFPSLAGPAVVQANAPSSPEDRARLEQLSRDRRAANGGVGPPAPSAQDPARAELADRIAKAEAEAARQLAAQKGAAEAKRVAREAERKEAERLSALDSARADLARELLELEGSQRDAAREIAYLAAGENEERRRALDLGFRLQDIERERQTALIANGEAVAKIVELGDLELAARQALLATDINRTAELQRQAAMRANEPPVEEGFLAKATAGLREELDRATPSADLLVSSIGQLGDGLFDALKAGEGFGESFKNVGREFLESVAKMTLKMLALRAAMSILNAAGGGGLGGLLGGLGGLGAAASGGFRRGLTLVGERGPELVRMPDAGAMVTSASRTKQIMAGGSAPIVNVFNNSSASVSTSSAPDGSIRVLIEQTVAKNIAAGGLVGKAVAQQGRTVRR